MKLLVSGDGKEDFAKGLEKLISFDKRTDCILLEINNDVTLGGSDFMNLLNTMEKPVNYGILKE